MADQERICILGMGFVGLPLSVTFAEAGFEVLGVDTSPDVIDRLERGVCPFFEAGLQDGLKAHGGRKLTFSRDIPDRSCAHYIVAVGTPLDPDTLRIRLDSVLAALGSVARVLKKGDTVVLRSTMPVGSSRGVALRALESRTSLRAGRDFSFGYAPERSVAGNALGEHRTLPQIFGAYDPESEKSIRGLFGSFNKNLVALPDMEHAEFCKALDNTYRDVQFAFANQAAAACERAGLDFHLIRRACNADYLRNAIAAASPGVGGSCLVKDPYILAELCEKLGLDAGLFLSGRAINTTMVPALADRLVRRLAEAGKDIRGSKVFLMGFAFKGEPQTSDARFSTTVDLVEILKPLSAELHGYDALVPGAFIENLGVRPCSIEEGFRGADAVVIMTDHRSHAGLDLRGLALRARRPLILADCWNLYEKAEARFDGSVVLI